MTKTRRALFSALALVLEIVGSADFRPALASNSLVAAVLPASRAVAVNVTATAFATIINAGNSPAQNCSPALPPGFTQATFSYQTTDPATNQVTGSPNTPVSIAAGAAQTFVFSVKPTVAFPQTDVAILFSCTSGETAASISGVNTFLLTASSQPTPDIVALAATVSNDGIVRTPGTSAIGAFSVATVNVGTGGTVVASVDTGTATVNASLTLCQTNAQAVCLQAPATSVTTSFNANQTGTFSIFVTSNGTVIPLDPANTRAFVRFKAGGTSVGATSVAVQTQITLGSGGGTLQLGAVGIGAGGLAVISPTDFAATPTSVPAPVPVRLTSLNTAYNITLNNKDSAPNNGLNGPVNVTLPYSGLGVNDPTRLAVLHFDPATGTYSPATIQDIDTNARTITFDSRRFSKFVPVLLPEADLPGAAFAPGFDPEVNGFQIVNDGNAYLSPSGNCLGMSSFALWYYQNRPTNLFGHYSDAGAPNSIADVVATRAHIMQSVYWNNEPPNFLLWQRTHPAVVQQWIRSYLSVFGVPFVTIVGREEPIFNPVAHAMLIFGYDANNFYFYDPDTPGVRQSVSYNANGFGTYGDFKFFTSIGSPSFGGPETFAQIATEGDSGFAASRNVTITSPQQNAMITSRQVQLRGSLGGGLNSLSQAAVFLNGSPAFQPIPVSGGSFNSTIDVASGQNTAVFLAGAPAYSAQLSNTLANSAAVILKYTGPASALFRSALRWNQNNTDLDQYVTEPTGATSWFGSHTTAAGLTLDFDNTSGFGPENTTIEANSTPIPGIYRVRVHYFSDHGTGQATDGSVTITLRERAPNQQQKIRLWALGISKPANAAPGSVGPDWVDIADVDVVNNVITLR